MINMSETILSLTDAAASLPRRRGGRKVHVATLYRWVQHGLSGVRLEAISVGGTVCTSREALQRFFEGLSFARGLPGAQPTPRTSRQRERAVERAENELAAAGI